MIQFCSFLLCLLLITVRKVFTIESTQIGLKSYGEFQNVLVNCGDSNSGGSGDDSNDNNDDAYSSGSNKNNQIWFYANPSTTDFKTPDQIIMIDPNGNHVWEGGTTTYSPDGGITTGSITLSTLAHQQQGFTLVGVEAVTANQNNGPQPFSFPCYTASQAQEDRIDFFNGTVCFRLYVCDFIPHVVMQLPFNSGIQGLTMSAQPGFNDNNPYTSFIQFANFQTTTSPSATVVWPDLEGNKFTYLITVNSNAPSLDWVVQGITNNAGTYGEQIRQLKGTDGLSQQFFPTSVSIVTYVGFGHQNFVSYNIVMIDAQRATNCPEKTGLSISSVLAGVIFAVAIAAVPVTGGASLIAGLGVAGAVTTGALTTASLFSC